MRCVVIAPNEVYDMRWMTKIYYLELLRALEGTLSHWSRLHLHQSSLRPRGGLWPVLFMLSIKKGCAPAAGTLIC
jgi:hypothetical protein